MAYILERDGSFCADHEHIECPRCAALAESNTGLPGRARQNVPIQQTKGDEMTHTPRPWIAKPRSALNDGAQDETLDGLGWDIDGPPQASLRGQYRKRADAFLAAAAPDLLAACEAVDRVIPYLMPGPVYLSVDEVKQIRAAIRKAKGDQLG